MFEDDHKGHTFEKLMNVYNKHLDKIKKEKEVLDDKLGELTSKASNIDKLITQIKDAKDARVKEIDAYVLNIHKKLESQMESKVQTLSTKKEKLRDDIVKLEKCNEQIVTNIEVSTKADLIKNSEDLIQFIREISTQVSTQNCYIDPVNTEFASEIVPEYENGKFVITNFSKVKEEKEIVYSDPIISNGITWRLKVYPNGNGQAKDNYLSVFLEMVKGYSSTAKYDYKIEMINQDHPDSAEHNVSREYTSEFEVGE